MKPISISIDRKVFSKIGKTEQQLVIKDLHVMLNPHEFTCLVGPSGCGKTTLLNIVSGLDTDFEGIIDIESPKSGEQSIGYVFQTPRLLPWCTVKENIDLALTPNAKPDQVDFLLHSMGLEKAVHAYPERLSLGMQRRVALARAFAIEPQLLIMDEPFVSLDPQTADRVRSLLLDVWKERPHTVLFVTHDLREAIALADRILFLSASPMQLRLDSPVDIPRSERHQENRQEAFRKILLKQLNEIHK